MDQTIVGVFENIFHKEGLLLKKCIEAFLGHTSPTMTQKYNKRKQSLDKNPAHTIDY
ncbi:MAG: hypothetical protein AB8G05_01020 [Oligoflexales bacterium]